MAILHLTIKWISPLAGFNTIMEVGIRIMVVTRRKLPPGWKVVFAG
jgi:hypothetical protein